MNRRDVLKRAGGLALAASAFPTGWAAAADSPKRRILFFTKSSGFEHPGVKRTTNSGGYAGRVLQGLAAPRGLEVTATKDGPVFPPETLAKYAAFFFSPPGALPPPGPDKTPPMTPEGKR